MFEEVRAHMYKHWKIMSRRPGEMAWIIVYPFIAILSIGILAMFLISKGAPLDSMLFVFLGVVTWNFYDISQRAITYGITYHIWSMSLKHMFATSAKTSHFIIGNALFGIISAIFAFMMVGLIGILLFKFNIFLLGGYLVNLFFIFIFATGIGLMINGLMITKGEKYMSLIWMGTGIIMIFSGIYYPISILPSAVQTISLMIPATHSLISMRVAVGAVAMPVIV